MTPREHSTGAEQRFATPDVCSLTPTGTDEPPWPLWPSAPLPPCHSSRWLPFSATVPTLWAKAPEGAVARDAVAFFFFFFLRKTQ